MPPVAATLDDAISMIEEMIDHQYARYLSHTYETASGIVRIKTMGDIATEGVRLETLANVLSKLHGYRVTASAIQSASYERIGGARLRDESEARVKARMERRGK